MEGTLAEIRMFAGNFSPRGWQFCNGQLLPIAQWTAVFALVGTTYGGNGQTTFGVPDLRGRVALGTGNGAGLPSVTLGEVAGVPSVTITTNQMPVHTHGITGTASIQAAGDGALGTDAAGRYLGPGSFYSSASELQTMGAAVTALNAAVAGSNVPFSNKSPYLGINYIFCVEGIFPSRN
jgi:microcystin-dependent protein